MRSKSDLVMNLKARPKGLWNEKNEEGVSERWDSMGEREARLGGSRTYLTQK